MGLRVSPKGLKNFVLQTRIKSRLRRITFKPAYPLLSVADARQRAMELKGAIGRGEDPVAEKQREREAPTFKDLVDSYLKDAEVRALRSLPRARRRLEVHGSRWYARKATDITREDIARLHQNIAEKSGRVIANRVVTLLRTIFNRALDQGIFKGENPAVRVKLFREEPRTRFLSPEEFARINTALAQEPNQYMAQLLRVTLVARTAAQRAAFRALVGY